VADTSTQMENLIQQTKELAALKGHELGPFKDFSGGAINISLCNKCSRFGIAEIFPQGHDVRGSALTFDCGGRKVENSI